MFLDSQFVASRKSDPFFLQPFMLILTNKTLWHGAKYLERCQHRNTASQKLGPESLVRDRGAAGHGPGRDNCGTERPNHRWSTWRTGK